MVDWNATCQYGRKGVEEVLAIGRIFSLVNHDNKHQLFQIVRMLIKLKDYGSKIYSLNIKIRFKAFDFALSRQNLFFH